MGLVESIVVSVIGFVVGGLIMTTIGFLTAKFFANRIVHNLLSNETKDRLYVWFSEVLSDGFGKAIEEYLKDEKIQELKNILVEILEEKLRQRNLK